MRFLFGDCVLDPTRRELARGGETIHVEPQVFDLLVHLVRNRDQVISKQEMLTAVWGGRIVSESTLSNRINAARRVIGDNGEQQAFIRTVPRRGLRFVADVREEPSQSAAAQHAGPQSPSTRMQVDGQRGRASKISPSPSERGYEVRGRPTIAVLPFDNMSGDPEQDYF